MKVSMPFIKLYKKFENKKKITLYLSKLIVEESSQTNIFNSFMMIVVSS